MRNGLTMALAAFLLMAQVVPATGKQPFSGKVDADSVSEVCQAVARWQLAHSADSKHHPLAWTYGALYVGLYEWADLTEDKTALDFLRGVGKKYNWSLLPREYHADDLCVGQAYLKLYQRSQDPKMLQAVRARAWYVATHPSTAPLSKRDKIGKGSRWSWSDALFMAPPVYAALYRLTGEEAYLRFMDAEFRETTDSLYDREAHLYYRDCLRIGKQESNGAKQFWARGDGWVFAGLAQILENLPADTPSRAYYEQIFKEMAEQIVATQDKAGHWHASLHDPASYPMPENSAGGFFVYGLGWGLRHGLLSGKAYEKAFTKGWKGLVEGVHADGMLGYVQPVGADPQKTDASTTDVYGVGAFLLAGSEMLRFARR